MKHTHGPWTVVSLANGDCFVQGAERVGEVMGRPYYREIMGDERYPEKLADAHIIAAAPELLEALEMALEWIDAVPQETPLPAMPGFNRDWANDLITKATAKGK